ncbi:phage tail tube protein [Collimonas humicola]|uniref:phage tail tube protein n=1 Tax=Collimonas humicola TaxID=2825886 RepID=UPI001B8D174C|nr:phage tail tube protein [Collimonas humicola]
MTIATGIAKQLRYKKELSFGVVATPNLPFAQSLRRVTSNLDLKKATYQSKEIRPDYQVANFRHGMRSVDGTISGELSVGTYKDFMATICRTAWTAAIASAALTTVTAAQTVGSGGTFTRSAGSWITDGFKTGDVVLWTGWLTTATGNNATNFYVTNLTPTVMSGFFLNGAAFSPKAAGDSVVVTQAGRKVAMAVSGQVNDSYTIEHWFSDIGQSEVFTGCRLNQMDVKLPATGFSTIDLNFMGKDMTPAQAAYFPTPMPVSNGGSLAAVNGALYLNGAQVGLITGMNIQAKAGMTSGEVVGQNTRPDIFMGAMEVSGQMTIYFQDNTIRDIFVNETEASAQCVFTTDNTPTANFIAFTMSRIKCGGASKDDGEKGLVMTVPYVALLDINGGPTSPNNNTTLTIQDSLA